MKTLPWIVLSAFGLALALIWWTIVPSRPNLPETIEGERSPLQHGLSGKRIGSEGSVRSDHEKKQTFEQWLKAWSESPNSVNMAEGMRLAESRRAVMKDWIRNDPKQAVANRLRFEEYARLPSQLAERIERPIATTGELSVYPFCPHPEGIVHFQPSHHAGYSLRNEQGMSWVLHFPADRRAVLSKRDYPVVGLEIEGELAVFADPALWLEGEELAAAAKLFNLSHEDGSGVLVGDRLFGTYGPAEVETMNSMLREAELMPGPDLVGRILAAFDGVVGSTAQVLSQAELAASTWTETPKSVLFLRLKYPDDDRLPANAGEVETLLNSISDRVEEMSFGKTWFDRTDVSEQVFELPNETDYYVGWSNGPDRMVADAWEAALDAGLDLGEYDMIGLLFPNSAFGWAGLATVGAGKLWINGTMSSRVFTHEFGHCYGLRHASSWLDDDGSILPEAGVDVSDTASQHSEYGDIFDMMGSGGFASGDFHAQGKRLLNWIEPDQVASVQEVSDEVYRLYAFDNLNSFGKGAMGLKVSYDDSETFWISLRSKFTENDLLSNGGYLQWEYPDPSNKMRVLDTTPDSEVSNYSDLLDGALAIGKTFVDRSELIAITPQEKGLDDGVPWLDVRVVVGIEGNNAPSASISAPVSILARETVTFTVEASDPDGDSLRYVWDFGDGSGQAGDASVDYQFQLGGVYEVSVQANDSKGGIVTATVTVEVDDPLLPWDQRVEGTGADFEKILYSKGRYVAFGDYAASVSVDGSLWFEQSNALYFKDAAPWGSGFIALVDFYDWNVSGWVSEVYESGDGHVWTKSHQFPFSTRLNAIVTGESSVVVVGDDGEIYRRSLDGGEWAMVDSSSENDLNDVAFGNGVLIAVGDYRTILRSTDGGTTWSELDPPTIFSEWTDIKLVKFGNSVFAIGGDRFGYSSNGLDWNYPSLSIRQPRDIVALAAGEGLYYAIGRAWNEGESAYDYTQYLSSDGVNWGAAPLEDGTWVNDVVITAHGIFTVGSENLLRKTQPISQSSDPVVQFTGPDRFDARTIQQFEVQASDDDSQTLYYYLQENGGRLLETSPNFEYERGVSGEIDLMVHVADGEGGMASRELNIIVEDPLAPWSEVDLGNVTTPVEVSYANGRIWALAGTQLISSFEGIEWLSTLVSFNGQAIASDGNEFWLVGSWYDSSQGVNRGKLASSVDGVEFVEYIPDTEIPALTDVAFGGGVWIAVGEDGLVLRKETNESSWETVDLGIDSRLFSVAYAEGLFVVGGYEGAVYKSDDGGESWQDLTVAANVQGLNWITEVQIIDDAILLGGTYLEVSRDYGYTWEVGVSDESMLTNVVSISSLDDGFYAVGQLYDSENGIWRQGEGFSRDGKNWDCVVRESQTYFMDSLFAAGRLILLRQDGYAEVSDRIEDPGELAVSVSGYDAITARRISNLLGSAQGGDQPYFYYWDLGDGVLKLQGSDLQGFPLVGGNRSGSLVVADSSGRTGRFDFEYEVRDPLLPWEPIEVLENVAYLDLLPWNGAYLMSTGWSVSLSSDGGNWEHFSTPLYVRSLAQDGEGLLAVGEVYDSTTASWFGGIATSKDGREWTLDSLRADERFYDVAIGDEGSAVAVGEAGQVYRRSNLEGVWEIAESGTDRALYSVVWAEDAFYFGGNLNGLYQSQDNGVTWVLVESDVSLSWIRKVLYRDGIIAAHGSSFMMSMDSGTTWQAPSSSALQPRSGSSLAYDGELFFAHGIEWNSTESIWEQFSYFSIDGINWERTASPHESSTAVAVFSEGRLWTLDWGGHMFRSGQFASKVDVWLRERLPGVSLIERDLSSDPDFDGLSNLWEYAFNGDPFEWTAQPFQLVDAFRTENGFEVYCRSGDEDISQWIELSLDLRSWDRAKLEFNADLDLWECADQEFQVIESERISGALWRLVIKLNNVDSSPVFMRLRAGFSPQVD